MINKIGKILIIIGLYFITSIGVSASSATYYISTTGNDTTGTGTLSSPWKTLAHACDGVSNAGDIIHVNSGSYTETTQCNLAVGVSIEGDGDSSVIKSTLTADWTPIITANSPEGTNGNQHISNIKLDGQNLSTFWAIYISGRSNVSVHDTTIVNFKDRGIIFAGKNDSEDGAPSIYATGNSYYNNVCSNSAAYNTPNGIYGRGCLNIGGQDGMLIYGNTITQNQRPEGYNGWPIKGWNDGYLKGVKIYNNTIVKKAYGGTYPGESGWDFAIELFHVSGVEIYSNTIQGSIDSNDQTRGSYGYSMWIHNNTISQPTLNSHYESGIILEFSSDKVIIENNTFNNTSMGVQFNTRDRSTVSDITIRNNLMTNLGRAGIDGNNGGGIVFITESTHNAILSNINIYNNTMIASSGNAPFEGIEFGDAISGSGGSASNINIKNNIITGFKYRWLGAGSPTHMSNVTVTNNNVYNNANDNNPLWPGGNPTSYVYSNNLSINPLFVSSSNYTLQSNSPMIDAGTNVGIVYNGSAPDIGYSESASSGIGNSGSGSGGNGGGGSSSSAGSTGGGATYSCPTGTAGVYPNCVATGVMNPPPLPVVVNSPIYFIKPIKINIRATKSISSKLVATLPYRTLVEVLEGSQNSEWVKVKTLDGKIGYVRSKYTQMLATPGTRVSISQPKLNLRKLESTNSQSLRLLKSSDILDVISVSPTTIWAKVKTKNGLIGFINKFYLVILP